MSFSKDKDPLSLNCNFLRGSIIIVEGQIGVGKTTFGRSLTKRLNDLGIPAVFYPETVHAPWLQLFISDIPKYAAGYEISCTTARLWTYEKALKMRNQGYACIIDRSLDGDMVFARTLKARGELTEEEFNVVESYSSKISETGIEPPDYLVYLRTQPDIAIRRTAKRDRKGEDGYDIRYFTQLHEEYERTIDDIAVNRHKLIIDWSNELDVDVVTEWSEDLDIGEEVLSGEYIDAVITKLRNDE